MNSALPIKQQLAQPANVAVVLELLTAQPPPTRNQLAKAVCRRLKLRDPKGDLQVATTAQALRDLEAQGHWTLPAPQARRTPTRSNAPTRLHQRVPAARGCPASLSKSKACNCSR